MIPKLAHITGENIRPLLANLAPAWNAPAITTYHRDNHAIRTAQYRYIRHADGGEELYDHATDENEWTNLAMRPEFTDIKAGLAKWQPKENAAEIPRGDGDGRTKGALK